jgi:hypothetical protein
VGQNNVELWSLESGGGWIHPVHIHMIDGFCVAIREDSGALKPCAPELFNVPKDVMHIGCAPLHPPLCLCVGQCILDTAPA